MNDNKVNKTEVTSISLLRLSLGDVGGTAVCAFCIDLLASASNFVSGFG